MRGRVNAIRTFKGLVADLRDNWCFYCKEKNILLIDSWHPGARKSQEEKIDEMMLNVNEFMVSEHPDF